jgi:hypothetical protein
LELRKTFIPVVVLVLLLAIFMAKFFFFRTSVRNVSAVEAVHDIGVYRDENCSTSVYSISWGVLSPGEVKEVVVYVRNEGNESFSLVLTPTNWNPGNASRYLIFSWSCGDDRIGVGDVVKVKQRLLVCPYTKGITDFIFDIIFDARKYFLSDVNKDGIVDMTDVAIVCMMYGYTQNDSKWNPDADLNKDGKVEMRDISLVARDYGKAWEH